MKEYGLNAARIPIGYWAFDVQPGESYLKLDQWAMLLRACGWAQKHGIKVIVDLHGAPGSQNGEHAGILLWLRYVSDFYLPSRKATITPAIEAPSIGGCGNKLSRSLPPSC